MVSPIFVTFGKRLGSENLPYLPKNKRFSVSLIINYKI